MICSTSAGNVKRPDHLPTGQVLGPDQPADHVWDLTNLRTKSWDLTYLMAMSWVLIYLGNKSWVLTYLRAMFWT